MEKVRAKLRRAGQAGDSAVEVYDRYSSASDRLEQNIGFNPVKQLLKWSFKLAMAAWGYFIVKGWPPLSGYGPLEWSLGALAFLVVASAAFYVASYLWSAGVRHLWPVGSGSGKAEGVVPARTSASATDQDRSEPASPAAQERRPETDSEREAKHRLAVFVVEHIIPEGFSCV